MYKTSRVILRLGACFRNEFGIHNGKNTCTKSQLVVARGSCQFRILTGAKSALPYVTKPIRNAATTQNRKKDLAGAAAVVVVATDRSDARVRLLRKRNDDLKTV